MTNWTSIEIKNMFKCLKDKSLSDLSYLYLRPVNDIKLKLGLCVYKLISNDSNDVIEAKKVLDIDTERDMFDFNDINEMFSIEIDTLKLLYNYYLARNKEKIMNNMERGLNIIKLLADENIAAYIDRNKDDYFTEDDFNNMHKNIMHLLKYHSDNILD